MYEDNTQLARNRPGDILPATPEATLATILSGGIDDQLASRAWQLIADARRILILAHEHPDPDALGSALGLAHALAPLGKDCVVACTDPVPAPYLAFLPGGADAVTDVPEGGADLVIALDAGEFSRYGPLYFKHREFFDQATTLNIDHHVTSTGCGQVNIIDPRCAATAEVLTVFLLNRGIEIGLDAARCLMAGIITDTRSFEYDATTSQTLMAGAYLVARGAIPERVIKPVYQMKPYEKASLWGIVLDRTLRRSADGRLVWAALRQAYLSEAQATPDMDDGLPSYLLDIEGAGIGALFKEQLDGRTRVSLRAADPHDAAAIAAHFGGGGHVRAAGFAVDLPIDAAIEQVIPFIEGRLNGR